MTNEPDNRKTDRIRIAEVLGWTDCWTDPEGCFGHQPDDNDCGTRRLPDFFTDPSAAEQVVVAMAKRDLTYTLISFQERDKTMRWIVAFLHDGGRFAGKAEGTGPSAAPYICRAALDAVKREGQDDGNDNQPLHYSLYKGIQR